MRSVLFVSRSETGRNWAAALAGGGWGTVGIGRTSVFSEF